VPTPENVRHVAALARAVALLRRSPEPAKPQKDALRALVALAAERSATLRWYANGLTLDGEAVSTADPRLAAFTERLVAQHVAEITIAKGAGPDELLALTMGLAADAGQGRIKERLRDAASARVMVVLHQYDQRSDRSVSAAFEKVKFDQGVLSEWNKFLEQGAKAESARVADSKPASEAAGARPAGSAAPRDTKATKRQAAVPLTAEPPPPPATQAPAAPRQPRPSTMQEGATPAGWFASFEKSVKNKFADHFGTADWVYKIDRATGTITADDRQGLSSLSVKLPPDYLEQSAWLIAAKLVDDLRQQAEKAGGLRKKK
jgi:hypothetical protein